MKQQAIIPSLLVFGPGTELPSPEVLHELRLELIENPRLSSLLEAAKNLPKFWQSLVDFDPSLDHIPGTKYLNDFQRWIVDGSPSPLSVSEPPYIYELPVTLILQVTQYVRYLTLLEVKNPHRLVLDGLQTGGIQGFCIGFLSAIAVSSSESVEQIAAGAAVGLRLAVCIGAYVDGNSIFAEPPDRTASLTIRWRSESDKEDVIGLIKTYPDAYIPSMNDSTSLTVTIPVASAASLTEQCHTHGRLAKPINVHGRYHSRIYAPTVDKLTKFIAQSRNLQFPSANDLQCPVRSTINGQIITEGSLSRIVLENTLSEPVDWHKTLQAAALDLPETHKVVVVSGFQNPIPSSLVQSSALRVIPLSSFQGLNSNGTIESNLNGTVTYSPSVNGSYHPTNGATNGTSPMEQAEIKYPPHSIAIVGMAGRFPGADSLDELWELLLRGDVMVEPAPTDRLKLPGPETGDLSGIRWWGNFIRDPDAFDHVFFKKSSREAIAWDPQQRKLLEVTYEALESAGYFGPSSTTEPNDYGCYIGAATNEYYDNLTSYSATAYGTPGTSRGFISGVVSHHFGWTGPSLVIDTACSSSLVAINTACRAIWSGECSRAIAGGTNVFTSPFDYRNLQASGFLSPTGQCKPFDIAGDGYCRGEAVGVVVLKPLSTAIKENDNILGVILGSAAGQNQNCSHITVPHAPSQANLYQKVTDYAGVKSEQVTYIEAHGTGTGVGDPVECQSIRESFGGKARKNTLYFSSLKGNIGHTEATAGIAGLMKVLMMMQHGKIPPQASFNKLNPKIPPLEPDQMEIPRGVLPWHPPFYLACVGSYGAAGNNSAVMVCQKPTKAPGTSHGGHNGVTHTSKLPLFISAGSANSLTMYLRKLLNWIKQTDAEIVTSSLTFNLADRANHSLSHIFSAAVTDMRDVEERLASAACGAGVLAVPSPKPVVLVFAGQESDFIGLSEAFYESSLLFRHHLDDCNNTLISLGFESMYPEIFQHTPILNLVKLHAALFSIQYASAKAWMDCGLKIDAVVGHSFGQLTALCISGVLSLSDALKLVAGRASIMIRYWGSDPGSMLFLQADRHTVSNIVDDFKSQGDGNYAEVACYNGPRSHVVVGSTEAIDALQVIVTRNASLQKAVTTKRLQVTHGFHSKFTEPLLPYLTELAKELSWKRPKIHLETTHDHPLAAVPDFRMIAEHTRQPVFFQRAVERLTQRYSQITWLEAGRGSSVLQLVRGSIPEPQGHLFAYPQLTISGAQDSLTDVTLNLWNAGHAVQYWNFYRGQRSQYQHLTLPPYQFEKYQHWLPFKGQVGEKVVQPDSIQATPVVHEFLSFLHFEDDSKTEAVFRIDPQSERFKSLLRSHIMTGLPLAPGSLYFEVAARAAYFLQSDPSAVDSYVPMVEDLLLKSPIGLDDSREISLSLKRIDGPRLAWGFSIRVQMQQRAADCLSEPVEQSTGIVCLQRRDDAQAAQRFKRFEALTGYRRYTEIINHPEAEKMQGNLIYRAFDHVVQYGESFRGMKTAACVGTEAVARVVMSVDTNEPSDQRVCDAPMLDSLMQPTGLLVNYFNNPTLEDVSVCNEVERIEIGGAFSPDAKEWIVFTNMTEAGESRVSADAYIFEAESKKMVMAAYGFRFSNMSQAFLGRLLNNANKSSPPDKADIKITSQMNENHPGNATFGSPAKAANQSPSKHQQLLQILHDITDKPLEELDDESTLDDLGIDSLMATEVINEVRQAFGITLDLATFLFLPNLQAIVNEVDSRLGVNGQESDHLSTPVTEPEVPKTNGVAHPDLHPKTPPPIMPRDPRIQPSITSAYKSFKEIRLGYDQLAVGTEAVNFWTQVYPDQARLVLAYVVEAYAELGCDLRKLQPGDAVPEVQSMIRHRRLLKQLYRILEDGRLISAINEKFIRTEIQVDTTPAEDLYQKILGLYPQHANIHKLVKVIGSQLAACLRGNAEGIQLLFGDAVNKRLLEDIYENWPLFRTPTLLLGDFLAKAFSSSSGSGRFRILEVGAGTGGTTRYIISHLQSHGIPFEYTFTDISASLVASARKKFKDVVGMSFEVLDIERTPAEHHEGSYHAIIATNTIHATRRLDQSLSNLRKMLRDDGVLTLIEITKRMFWLDIVFGQFEGWWLFEDGRTHATVSEVQWERQMKAAGFNEVLWTDGNMPESRTVRVIGAFPSAPAGTDNKNDKSSKAIVEEVVYKKIGNLEICADVYYPASDLPDTKMPIALMIHGGSHTMFTRKDIRPPQTRILLESGFLPVSLDHRLCPEISLSEGPMVDVCDALEWARYTLPYMKLKRPDIQIDGERVVVVGWSSGGQLAMSLAWTAPLKGLRPPEAILAFYCPTDYEDDWWKRPIQPRGAEDKGYEYDVLEAVQDEPVTSYGLVGAWEPLSDPRILTDARCRIVLHMNWKAQMVPIIANGLPSKKKADTDGTVNNWNALPQPSAEKIIPISPLAQIIRGNYKTPTFLIHGTNDDLVPWEQSQATYNALLKQGVATQLELVKDGPHVCDRSTDLESDGWKAVLKGYKWLSSYVF